jgi:hypothetical protein
MDLAVFVPSFCDAESGEEATMVSKDGGLTDIYCDVIHASMRCILLGLDYLARSGPLPFSIPTIITQNTRTSTITTDCITTPSHPIHIFGNSLDRYYLPCSKV